MSNKIIPKNIIFKVLFFLSAIIVITTIGKFIYSNIIFQNNEKQFDEFGFSYITVGWEKDGNVVIEYTIDFYKMEIIERKKVEYNANENKQLILYNNQYYIEEKLKSLSKNQIDDCQKAFKLVDFKTWKNEINNPTNEYYWFVEAYYADGDGLRFYGTKDKFPIDEQFICALELSGICFDDWKSSIQ